MDQIKEIIDTQLTEQEVMVFLLLQDGKYTQDELAKVLLTNQPKIWRTYTSAREKLDKLGEIFSTKVDQKKL